jgi:tagatose 6-phosphate kinase
VIVTVTLDPALEVEYEAEKVRVGKPNPVRRVSYRAAGRGLAVARILQTFGHDVVAAGLAGGPTGELIRADMARAGVATQFTRIAADTRRVTVISEKASGSTTSFAEPAGYITTEELGRLARDYRALLDGATAVVLCGSLPDSLPAETYASLVSYAGQASVPVILDASGSALASGAARRPALAILAAPARVPIAGPRSLALLGDEVLQVLTPDGQWQVTLAAPGQADDQRRDAVVAGFVPGIALSWAWPDMLRHAAALAAGWDPRGQFDVGEYERALTAASVRAVAPAQ